MLAENLNILTVMFLNSTIIRNNFISFNQGSSSDEGYFLYVIRFPGENTDVKMFEMTDNTFIYNNDFTLKSSFIYFQTGFYDYYSSSMILRNVFENFNFEQSDE